MTNWAIHSRMPQRRQPYMHPSMLTDEADESAVRRIRITSWLAQAGLGDVVWHAWHLHQPRQWSANGARYASGIRHLQQEPPMQGLPALAPEARSKPACCYPRTCCACSNARVLCIMTDLMEAAKHAQVRNLHSLRTSCGVSAPAVGKDSMRAASGYTARGQEPGTRQSRRQSKHKVITLLTASRLCSWRPFESRSWCHRHGDLAVTPM